MLALGKRPEPGRSLGIRYQVSDGGIEVATVAFHGATAEVKPKRKRWAVLTSKRGRTYYHNTETGEDRWDKPADLDAEAVEDAFVPFKNDAFC
ncbi:Zinc ion binding protein [Phytophthora palmivora]|uniref:Zinc ion binding protein n=1 Tax=Phytophthora palmivora TaxID=4796 RepID=A0A2P4YGR6_9STRA|nr:Zinc ion binding protein [Phytophthora palmivora]